MIAVIGKNRELGKNNTLLWNIPEDLARFQTITTGHPVILGRKTYQSIGRALPGRTNIVISSDRSFTANGIYVVASLDEAIGKAKQSYGSEEVFIIGGGSVYAQAITLADRLYLTVVDQSADADAFFPEYSQFSKIRSKETHDDGTYRYSYITLEK